MSQEPLSENPRCRLALLLLLCLPTVSCSMLHASPASRPEVGWQVGRIADERISESSGLVASRRHPGVLWTHNDSGDEPRIFAIDLQGAVLGEYQVEGARAQDWEDIAIDDSGHLYIGDIGNNKSDRRDLAIYRIAEPDPRSEKPAEATRVERVFRFRYAEQTDYSRSDEANFDAESLIWWQGSLYVFTKHRSDTRTRIYRIPRDAPDEEIAVSAIGSMDVGGERALFAGNTTGADIRPDGSLVALLGYNGILLYEPDENMLPRGPVGRIDLHWRQTGQVEGIAFVGEALVFGNEGRDLYRIDDPLAPRWRRFPP